MPDANQPEVVIQEEIELRSGQEWHSEPIHFDPGDVVTVQARRERKDHTEAEAAYCIIRGIVDSGHRVVLPPGQHLSHREGRVVRRKPSP
jgi:hypothetical protein